MNTRKITALGSLSGLSQLRQRVTLVYQGVRPETYFSLFEPVLRMEKARFPDAKIHITDIGPIIGARTGSGMLALIFWGNVR